MFRYIVFLVKSRFEILYLANLVVLWKHFGKMFTKDGKKKMVKSIM